MPDHTYHYAGASTVTLERGRTSVDLFTAGGRSDHPHFFEGFIEHPAQTAQAMLAVAEVARTRYFDPGALTRAKDPIVTSNRSILRFESFSACNGVYARFDIEGDGLDDEYIDWGTTNVDFNQPMRTALARIGANDPLHLSVGQDEVVLRTLEGSEVEKKVPLPARWLKGMAEVQVASSGMLLQHELPQAAARKLLRDLPRRRVGQGAAWVTWTATGARLTRNPGPGDVCLAGPQRLGTLQRMVPFVEGIRVFAPPPQQRLTVGSRRTAERAVQPSAWEIVLRDARLVLVLSPEVYRGFSGEGGVLEALMAAKDSVIEAISNHLDGQASLALDEVVADTSEDDAVQALRALGAAGRVGFDLGTGGFFHRDLPFDRTSLDELQPRLVNARTLVDQQAVTMGRDRASVLSDGTTYAVRFEADGAHCTCPWFAKHRGERGPCKHVLAAQIVSSRTEVDS